MKYTVPVISANQIAQVYQVLVLLHYLLLKNTPRHLSVTHPQNYHYDGSFF